VAVAPEALAPAASDTAEQLFQEHSRWIYGYCLRILRSPEEAEDALQTTYLNACRSLNQGTRPLVGSAWLLRIAQNVCFARLRSAGRRDRLERLQDIAVLEETVAAPERSPADLIGLTDALRRLPERQREAILLREWQGLSYRELADRLDLTQAATETLIFRARRSLAATLEESGVRGRRKALHSLDLGGLVAMLKTVFAGTAGSKAAAVLTAAVATTTGIVSVDPVDVWHDRTEPEVTRMTSPAPKSAPPAALVSLTSPAPALGPPASEHRLSAELSEGAVRTAERLPVAGTPTATPAKRTDEKWGPAGTTGEQTEKAPGTEAQTEKAPGTGEQTEKAPGNHTKKPASAGDNSQTRSPPAHARNRPEPRGRSSSPPAASRDRTPPAQSKRDRPEARQTERPPPTGPEGGTPPAQSKSDRPEPGRKENAPPGPPAQGKAEPATGKASKG
jgi:RNA polymerase sigma factor (sigma-70 family)